MLDSPYIYYFAHFNASRDYFSCHEILEDHWKRCSGQSKDAVEVGFIQLAVGQYHYRNANFSGALKMFNRAKRNFTINGNEVCSIGVNYDILMADLDDLVYRVSEKLKFRDIDIVLTNRELEYKVKDICRANNWEWLRGSDLSNLNLVKKHLFRDS